MRILVYLTKRVHPAMWDNMVSLAEGFSKLGHEVKLCDIHDGDTLREVLDNFLDRPDYYDMSTGFNDLGMEWYINGESKPFQLYSELNLPHVSIMLDEPFNGCASGYGVPCKNHIVTYLDRSDLKALEIRYPDKAMKKLFLPLGGP